MPPVKKFRVAKTHGDSLNTICAACWRKKGSVRPVTEKLAELLCQFVYSDYSREGRIHPSVICDVCRITITGLEKV